MHDVPMCVLFSVFTWLLSPKNGKLWFPYCFSVEKFLFNLIKWIFNLSQNETSKLSKKLLIGWMVWFHFYEDRTEPKALGKCNNTNNTRDKSRKGKPRKNTNKNFKENEVKYIMKITFKRVVLRSLKFSKTNDNSRQLCAITWSYTVTYKNI